MRRLVSRPGSSAVSLVFRANSIAARGPRSARARHRRSSWRRGGIASSADGADEETGRVSGSAERAGAGAGLARREEGRLGRRPVCPVIRKIPGRYRESSRPRELAVHHSDPELADGLRHFFCRGAGHGISTKVVVGMDRGNALINALRPAMRTLNPARWGQRAPPLRPIGPNTAHSTRRRRKRRGAVESATGSVTVTGPATLAAPVLFQIVSGQGTMPRSAVASTA